jgi:hypothetical protein
MWSTIGYLRAMFDESLPVSPIVERAAMRRGVLLAEEARRYVASPVDTRETLCTVTQGRNGHAGVLS